MQTASNPLREGLSNRPPPKPCALVIFGATGDLTHRKLVPALYNLAADGDLPPGSVIIGFARRDKSDDVFRQEMEEATKKFSRQPVQQELWDHFAQTLFYHRSEFDKDEGYDALKTRIEQLDQEHNLGGRRMFYLAAGPEQFEPIISRLKKAGSTSRARRTAGRAWWWKNPSARTCPARGTSTRWSATRSRIEHVPHRPFPRQGNRAEHHGPAVRQRHFRADLEQPLHRPHRDHGGGNARRRGARRLLRDERGAARHGAKPSHPAPDPRMHGAADRPRRGQRARREGQSPALAAAVQERRRRETARRARAVRGGGDQRCVRPGVPGGTERQSRGR